MLSIVLVHIRHGLRSLLRTPVISAAAILCLAGAIGAATAVFTIVNGVMLRPLPFANAGRLLAIWGADPARDNVLRGFSWLDAKDLAEQGHVLDALAVMENTNGGMTLTGRGEPVQIPSRTVSGNFFDVLGVTAAFGRALTPADDDPASAAVVVLSDGLWRQRFGADPRIVGAALTLDGRPYLVAGVMPRPFAYPRGAQFWVTVAHSNPDLVKDRTLGWLEIIGLAKPGTSPDAVAADLRDVFDRISKAFHPSRGPEQLSVVPLERELLGDVRAGLWAVLAAVCVLLAVACSNVGGLLLVRGSARRHDVALRVALGAGRRHLLGQALAESALIAAASGVLGTLLAVQIVDVTKSLAPGDIPRLADVAVDVRVLSFAIGAVVLTTLICGLIPGSRISAGVRPLLAERGGTPARDRMSLGRILAAGEIALSVLLMVSAGLVGRTFVQLRNLDVGFSADRVLAFTVPVPATRYSRPEDHRRLNDQLLARLTGLPGVRSAAAVLLRPLWGTVGLDWTVTIEGQAPADAVSNPLVNLEPVSENYFQTLGIPVLEGRAIDAGDRDGRPAVAVVGRTFARRFWPDGNAIGRRLRFPLPGSPYDRQWFTVVGIVGDARYRGLRNPRLDLYISDVQGPYPAHQYVVRADGDPAALVGAVRAAVTEIDRDLPIDDVIVLSDAVELAMANPRFTARVFTAFAFSAIALAAIGLATLISFQVRQRTRELAIRLALGATTGHVVRLVLADNSRLVLGGIAAGLALAAATTMNLRALLFGVSPLDPLVMIAAALLTSAVGLTSAYLPARRTATIDPTIALRSE